MQPRHTRASAKLILGAHLQEVIPGQVHTKRVAIADPPSVHGGLGKEIVLIDLNAERILARLLGPK